MSEVRLSFPARTDYLILARLALAGIARGVCIDEETLADLKLAVTEACGNAVRHAYPNGDGEGVVRVAFDVFDGSISVTVEDDGVGLPVDGIGAVRPDELPESGMGLAIIDAIADDLEIRRAHDAGGTVLRFRKSI